MGTQGICWNSQLFSFLSIYRAGVFGSEGRGNTISPGRFWPPWIGFSLEYPFPYSLQLSAGTGPPLPLRKGWLAKRNLIRAKHIAFVAAGTERARENLQQLESCPLIARPDLVCAGLCWSSGSHCSSSSAKLPCVASALGAGSKPVVLSTEGREH